MSRRSASGGAGRLPLSVRLGSAFAAVFLVVVAVLVVLAYWGVGRMLRQDLDRALVDVVAQVDASGSAMTTSADRKLGGVESSEVETQLLDRAGKIVGASDDDLRRVPLLDRAQLADVLDQDVLFTDASDGDDPYRVLARPLPRDAGEVQVFAMDGDTVVDAQAALVSLAGPLAACAALLAGLTGWVVARRGLRPLTELTSQADALNPADPVPPSRAAPLAERGRPPRQDAERTAGPDRGRASAGATVHGGRQPRAPDPVGDPARRGGAAARPDRGGLIPARAAGQRTRGVRPADRPRRRPARGGAGRRRPDGPRPPGRRGGDRRRPAAPLLRARRVAGACA